MLNYKNERVNNGGNILLLIHGPIYIIKRRGERKLIAYYINNKMMN